MFFARLMVLFLVAFAAQAQYPAWRAGRAVDQLFDIPNTAGTLTTLFGGDGQWASDMIDGWGALAVGDNGDWYNAWGTGHRDWRNQVTKLDLNLDVPAWTMLHVPSPKSAVIGADGKPYPPAGPYYLDGRPVATEMCYDMLFLPARFAADGKERIMRFTANAAYATGLPNYFAGGYEVDGFRIADRDDDAADTWPTVPYAKNNAHWYSAKTMDLRTGDVYLSASDSTDGKQLMHWRAATNTWSPLQTSPIYPSHRRLESWARLPLILDPARNRLVTITKSIYTDACGPSCSWIMQTVDLGTGAVVNYPITGALPPSNGQGRGLVYDPDNDRYVYFDYRGYPATSCTIYAVDPTTAATRVISSCRIPKTSVEGRVGYFPQLGGIAYFAKSTQAVQFLPTR